MLNILVFNSDFSNYQINNIFINSYEEQKNIYLFKDLFSKISLHSFKCDSTEEIFVDCDSSNFFSNAYISNKNLLSNYVINNFPLIFSNIKNSLNNIKYNINDNAGNIFNDVIDANFSRISF